MKLYLLLLTVLLDKCYGDAFERGPSLNTADAVSKAANYLLNRTETENGGKNVIPRTVVALALAARSGIINDTTWLPSLRKELNIQIYMHLSQRQAQLKPSSFELAQYVNALYATCQDPRDFHGMNLVARLRAAVDSDVNRIATQNVVSPFPLLTLCVAREARGDDYRRLHRIFRETGNDRLSLKALAVMALACCNIKDARDRLVSRFVEDVRSEFNTTDVYTKSLSVQALYALRALQASEEEIKLSLLQHQLPDGSFGDALSTYYAIPALLSKSLLNLRCESGSYREQPATLRLWDSFADASGKVTYSIWINKGSLSITHSVMIVLHKNETFFDVMRRAESENKAFSFLYDSTSNGKKVYSLAGIANDAEVGKAWHLYRGVEGNVILNSKHNLRKQTEGVDQIWPKDHEHFVFWFEQDSN